MFVHLALVERLAPVDDLLLRELAFFALLLPVLILLDERDLALDDPGLAPEPVAEPVGTDPKQQSYHISPTLLKYLYTWVASRQPPSRNSQRIAVFGGRKAHLSTPRLSTF